MRKTAYTIFVFLLGALATLWIMSDKKPEFQEAKSTIQQQGAPPVATPEPSLAPGSPLSNVKPRIPSPLASPSTSPLKAAEVTPTTNNSKKAEVVSPENGKSIGKTKLPVANFNPVLQQTLFERGAVIHGRVEFLGTHARVPLRVNSDPACLQKQDPSTPLLSEDIVSNEGGLQNVIVYIKTFSNYFEKPGVTLPPVRLVQEGCHYIPHVIALVKDQPLVIENLDPALHNVHAIAKTNAGFNIGQPSAGAKNEKRFSKAELGIRLKCDVHGWMSAFVGVFDHPYFSVTNETGEFAIRGLPPGDYTVEAWHEKLGVRTKPVRIDSEMDSKRLELKF